MLFPAMIHTAELTMVTANSKGMRILWSAGMSFDTCLRSSCAILAAVSEQSVELWSEMSIICEAPVVKN